MNAPAVKLYASHGIDLYSEPLEIAVCAQHNNGGFSVDKDYRSTTLPHLYVIGEAAGVFGIHRPGGSALNSTQVSSRRAADHIARQAPRKFAELDKLPLFDIISLFSEKTSLTVAEILKKRHEYGKRMSTCGAFIRREGEIKTAIGEIRAELHGFGKYSASDIKALRELLINRDVLVTQLVYLEAISEYINHGGLSRGSYIICRDDGIDADKIDTAHRDRVCETTLTNGAVIHKWSPVRPIPQRDNWFENVYNRFGSC